MAFVHPTFLYKAMDWVRGPETVRAMDVMMSGRSSALNPYAPPFVPSAYRAVEDFSDEWWRLVRSTPWFRDYWIRECFHEEDLEGEDDDDGFLNDPDLSDFCDPALSNTDVLFHSYASPQEEEEKKKVRKEVMTWGMEKWMGAVRGQVEMPKYYEKAPKIVSMRVSPRTIQQPR